MVINKGTECSFCKHVYIFPCNGKRYDCANAVWKRSNQTIDIYKLSYNEIEKFRQSGNKLPSVETTEKSKKKKLRIRLEEPSKKKERIRL